MKTIISYLSKISLAVIMCLSLTACPDDNVIDDITDNNTAKNETFVVKGVSFTMVAVEGGTFVMGATEEQGDDYYDNEKPTHKVTLSGFSIGQTEVTQALWEAVMGENPSFFGSRYSNYLNRPVEKVTWNDCQNFISKINGLTGKRFRLPTEAEWEFAARGGNKSKGYKYAGSNNIDDVAWYSGNAYDVGTEDWDNFGTHAVGTKKANELGLYDMSGNVWEWCSDWQGEYSAEPQTNPIGAQSGVLRVHRGGGWGYGEKRCRVSSRYGFTPYGEDRCHGLRLAL